MPNYDANPPVFFDSGATYDTAAPQPKKNKMAKIKNTWGKMSRDQRLVFANEIKTALTGNANVPTPKPTLVDFAALIADAQDKRSAVSTLETQLRTARIADAEAQDALVAALEKQSVTVESATDGDPLKIATTGYAVIGPAQSSQPVGQPQNFAVTASDMEGTLDGQCDPVPNAHSYEVQTTAEPNVANSWALVLTSLRSTFQLTGLTSGARLWVRVRALGALGPGPWSDPATKIVP